jgi:hypothetical protein
VKTRKTFATSSGPVCFDRLSTVRVPTLGTLRDRSATGLHAVVPVVHTPYDYDERFFNS